MKMNKRQIAGLIITVLGAVLGTGALAFKLTGRRIEEIAGETLPVWTEWLSSTQLCVAIVLVLVGVLLVLFPRRKINQPPPLTKK